MQKEETYRQNSPHTPHNKRFENHIILNLKKKIKNNNLVITNADKGAGMVVVDRTEYNSKVTTFINNNQYTEINRNPLQNMINDTNNVMKRTSETSNH